MTEKGTGSPKKCKMTLWVGLVTSCVVTVGAVLATGFMVEATSSDKFCVSCHVMTPFRTAWQNSVHGGKNSKGVVAQCVDCHLPHGNFVEYLVAKAATGTHDVIANMSIDPLNKDWAKSAEEKRSEFTFDSSCRKCHEELTPAGLPRGGFLAHRSYLLGEANKTCTECHQHVGHKDMLSETDKFFKRNTL